MQPTELHELRELLEDFVQAIRNVDENDLEQHQLIHNQYRALYHVYAQLSQEEIDMNFEEGEIKLIEYFHLGMNYENEFNDLLTSVQQNLQSTLDFIGSNKGFHLLNSQKEFDKYTEEELQALFGTLFGIQLSKECVKSLRAEKIGSILGYALSGKFELLKPSLMGLSDIQKLESIKRDIQLHDVCLKYTFHEEKDGVSVDVEFDVQNANRTSVRGRNRADNCFINHATKTIHVGSVTSNTDASTQGYSFYKPYAALSTLTSMKTLPNGKNNPYYGFQVKPYMMLNARFSLHTDGHYQKGSKFRDMLRKATPKELRLINQLPFMRMIANCANQEHLESLINHDVYIIGCDTSNLHRELAKIQQLPKEERISALRDVTLTSLRTIVTGISKNKVDLSHGNSTRTKEMIHDIVDSTQNILQKTKLSVDESYHQHYIAPLREGLMGLLEQLDASHNDNQAKADIMTKLAGLIDHLEEPFFCNRLINQDKSKAIKTIEYIGSNPDVSAERDNYKKIVAEKKEQLKEFILDEVAATLTEVFPRRGKAIVGYYKDYQLHHDWQDRKNLYNNLSTAMSSLTDRGYYSSSPYIKILSALRESLVYNMDVYDTLIKLNFSNKIEQEVKTIKKMEKETQQFSL